MPELTNSQMAHNPLEGERPEMSIKLHENSEDHVSIIVVHKDKPEFLNICLQSIAVTSFNNNYEIVVVDNGSGEDSQSFLEDIKDEEQNSDLERISNDEFEIPKMKSKKKEISIEDIDDDMDEDSLKESRLSKTTMRKSSKTSSDKNMHNDED